MTIQTFSSLGALFAKQSTDIWERLSYVRESYTYRGVLGAVRFGEETITDLLMIDLYIQGSTVAYFQQTSRSDESMWGTDFELWLGSEGMGWFRFAIQAKKLDLRTDRYSSLTQSNSNGQQIGLLQQYAQYNRAVPLYCLYNHTDDADKSKHWHCCTKPANLKELGCTVTPLDTIATAIDTWGGKNFDSIHKNESTLPWKCLVSCPKVWNTHKVIASSLFDPELCRHETLPIVLQRNIGEGVVRESERRGSLISIPVDPDRDIDNAMDKFELKSRRDFRERYHRKARLPKAAAVIEV